MDLLDDRGAGSDRVLEMGLEVVDVDVGGCPGGLCAIEGGSVKSLTIVAELENYCGMTVEAGGCFEALADPVRRRVVELLGDGPRRAGELARSTNTTAAAM